MGPRGSAAQGRPEAAGTARRGLAGPAPPWPPLRPAAPGALTRRRCGAEGGGSTARRRARRGEPSPAASVARPGRDSRGGHPRGSPLSRGRPGLAAEGAGAAGAKVKPLLGGWGTRRAQEQPHGDSMESSLHQAAAEPHRVPCPSHSSQHSSVLTAPAVPAFTAAPGGKRPPRTSPMDQTGWWKSRFHMLLLPQAPASTEQLHPPTDMIFMRTFEALINDTRYKVKKYSVEIVIQQIRTDIKQSSNPLCSIL